MKKISLILLAGGKGVRLQAEIPKVFLPLKGKAIVLHSFDLFSSMEIIDEIVVVCPEIYRSYFPADTLFALPGKERQDSMKNGLECTTGEIILIHDSARPFITREEVEELLKEGIPIGAAALGTPIKNTIKQLSHSRLVEKTLDRSTLYEIQTPQLLRRDLLEQGLAEARGRIFTDDVALAELIGHPVKIVLGRPNNIKITYPVDLQLATIL